MLVKLILSAVIIVSCTLLGIQYGENLKKRVKELNVLLQAVNLMRANIQYTFTPLPQIFDDIGRKSNEPLKSLFMNISKKLSENEVDSVYDAFYLELFEGKNQLNLKKDDKEIIIDLAKSLGDTDVEGQNSVLNLTELKLKKQIENAEVELNKNLKVYRYLGFSIGASIVILIV